MYYYAYINSDSIVTGVYQLPTEVSMAGYIAITQEQYTNGNLVGKFYNAETGEFVSLPDWIGSTDEVKYKQTAVVLSAKLDAMDEAIASAQAGADGASAYEIAVANGFEGSEEQWLASLVGATGATGEQGVQGEKGDKGDKGDTGETGAAGASGQNGTTVIVGTTTTGNAGTNANVTGTLNSETNTLTLDFTIPKGANGESGTSASITADEVLTKIKTVDGANSGLDADTLDGVHANGFATADHTHSNYATVSALETLSETVDGKANAVHTHSGYASTSDIETLQTAINGKANANHTHTEYAAANHTHSDYASVDDVEALETALSGKADTSHTHGVATTSANGFLSSADKSKLDGIATGANKTTVDSALSSTSTNPVQNKVINTAIAGKANTSHTHTLDDVSETTNKKVMTAAERTKLSGIETGANKYTHPSTHAASMITGLSSVATSGKFGDLTGVPASFAPSAHTHAQSEITGLTTALSGKADANHTHNYCTLNQVYPVGSIYLSVNSANPSTLFGGTWVAFGTGKVLMGVKSGGSAEATGGSESATISAHTHTTANHKLTVEEMPPHHHEILNYNENGVTTDTFTKNSVEGLIKKGWTGNVMTSYTGGNQAHSHGNTGSAGAATISVVQPYITCYMWKRTN